MSSPDDSQPPRRDDDDQTRDALAWLHWRLRRARFPLDAISSRAGQLSLTFHLAGQAFEVDLSPPKAAGPCFAETGRFAVSYRGDSLSARQGALLEALVKALGKLERRLPKRLTKAAVGTVAGGVAGGAEADAPHVVLSNRYEFCTVEHTLGPDGDRYELLLRVTSKCNQRCAFCSGPLPFDEPEPEALGRCLADAAQLIPDAQITLTGGEPLLRPDLTALAEGLLSEPRVPLICIQTNAVHAERCAALPPSARLLFFVSLHAADDDLYNRCTGTEGQFPKAVAGIGQLLARGHRVIINCVVNRLNVDHLEALVRQVKDFTAIAPLKALHFSIMMCPTYRDDAPELLVPYGEAAPRLEAAIALAQELALPVASLLSSTHASIPACLLSESLRAERHQQVDFGEQESGYEDETRAWIKAKSCTRCREDGRCLGLPRPYYRRFGAAELAPIDPE